MVFSIFRVAQPWLQSSLEHFCRPQKEGLYPLAITPNFPPPVSSLTPPDLGDHVWLLASMDKPSLDSPHRQNDTICGLWCLDSSTWQNVFEVHSCCNRFLYFVSFYCSIIFPSLDIHISFTHASLDGHLGCFHLDPKLFCWNPSSP